MRLPNITSSALVKVTFARYVVARLRVSGKNDMSDNIATTANTVLQKQRGLEDKEIPVQDAYAYRDASGDVLSNLVRTVRLQLSARSLQATKTSPYTDIFYKGTEYYTSTGVDEVPVRIREFLGHLAQHLPESDAVRVEIAPKIAAAVDTYQAQQKAIADGKLAVTLAQSDLSNAEEDLLRLLERTYGALVSEHSKTEAERFFPSVRGTSKVGKEKDAGGDAGTGVNG